MSKKKHQNTRDGLIHVPEMIGRQTVVRILQANMATPDYFHFEFDINK